MPSLAGLKCGGHRPPLQVFLGLGWGAFEDVFRFGKGAMLAFGEAGGFVADGGGAGLAGDGEIEKHQGRRFSAASITQAFSMRWRCASGCLAESIQLIKSLRSTGVRSLH